MQPDKLIVYQYKGTLAESCKCESIIIILSHLQTENLGKVSSDTPASPNMQLQAMLLSDNP